MTTVAAAERLNRRCSRYGNPAVYAKDAFPWTAQLEQAWPAIRGELDRVLERRTELPSIHEITPDARSISTDANWKTFILIGYGVLSPPNIALCPRTWQAVCAIPGLKTAMFSVFEPGKRLPPHRGPYNGVLRLHLGLKVPVGEVGIRVGGQRCSWREGEALIFDDAYEHEAWNETGEPRVVLFVDFIKPLRFPANLINRLILSLAVFSPFVREGTENLRAWEQRFHRPEVAQS